MQAGMREAWQVFGRSARWFPGELFTTASRVGFLAWCVRTVFAGSRTPAREVPSRLALYGRDHVGAVVAGGVLLSALTVVAKVVPDAAIARLDDDSRRRASAWELAIKNVTVIPFTITWMVIGVRHASETDRSARQLSTARSRSSS